jgi:uncharacterized protein YbjT (DUF2867 family)
MRIVVIGGTGLIGSKLVHTLNEHGHDAVAAAPSTGVNTLTGEGLPEVLAGADVVVDVSNSPTLDDAAIEFFRTATTNLLTAEKDAGVGHHVALSVVGTAQLAPQSGYFEGKLLQENLIAEGPIPYTLVHATQFFEFINTLADGQTVDGAVRVPPAYFQPMAAADVAEGLAIAAVNAPVKGITEIGGPQAFLLSDLIPARSSRIPKHSTGASTSTSAPSAPVRARRCSTPGSRTGSSNQPRRRSETA